MSQYVRNMGAMIGQSTIQRLLGMLTTIVLARVLGSANFGIYSIVVNTAGSAYGLVRMGIDAAIHVYTAEHYLDAETREAKGQMLGAGLILLMGAGIMGAVICLVFAHWIADVIYGQPELKHWIRLAAVLVFFQCASQFVYTLLAGLHRFLEYARVMVISVAGSTVIISAASVLWGLKGALGGLIAMQAVTLLLLYRQAHVAMSHEKISIRFRKLTEKAKLLLRNGFPFYAAGLISVPVTFYLHGLITQSSGLEAMGGLRIIASITVLISFIPTAIAAVMISHFSRSSTNEYEMFVSSTLLNFKYVWLLVLIVSAAVLTFLSLIIYVLFGSSYQIFVGPASISIISSVFACLLGIVGNLSLSRKRVDFIFFYTFIQMGVFFIIAFFAVPKYGLTGYFFAELSGLICALGFVWKATSVWRKRNRVSAPWVRILFAVSAIFVVSFSFVGIFGSNIIRASVGFVCLMLVLSLGYWGVLDAVERTSFVLIIRKRLVRYFPTRP